MTSLLFRKEVALLGALVVGPATAAPFSDAWQADVRLLERVFYDDNLRFESRDEIARWGQVFRPQLSLLRESGRVRHRVDGALEFERYRNASALNSDNQFIDLSSLFRRERSEWQLDTGYHRTSTRDTELEDSGNLGVAERVENWYARPSARFQLSELRALNVGYSYRTTDYHSGAFTDFREHDFNVGHSWQAGPRLVLTSGLGYQHYDAIGRDSEADTYNLNLGLRRDVSRRLRVALNAGVYHTRSETAFRSPFGDLSTDDETTGFGFSSSLTWLTELTTAALTLDRGISPSSQGTVEERDLIRLAITRRVSERMSLKLDVDGSRNNSVSADVGNDQRVYLSFSPGLLWQFTRDLSLDVSYQFRRQDGDNFDGVVEGNIVSFALTYEIPDAGRFK